MFHSATSTSDILLAAFERGERGTSKPEGWVGQKLLGRLKKSWDRIGRKSDILGKERENFFLSLLSVLTHFDFLLENQLRPFFYYCYLGMC